MASFFSRKNRLSDIRPTYMIVGLGNPGPEYKNTRHNIGFLVLDHLAIIEKIALKTRKHQALYGVGQIEEQPVLLVKPMTYMNKSGEAVAALARQYSIATDNILVVGDDLALPLGKIRLRAKGSAGGHNGHRSLIASLKTEVYPRLRIGIGKSEGKEVSDYVLSDFSYHERDAVNQLIIAAAEGCKVFLKEGVEKAMSILNSQK